MKFVSALEDGTVAVVSIIVHVNREVFEANGAFTHAPGITIKSPIGELVEVVDVGFFSSLAFFPRDDVARGRLVWDDHHRAGPHFAQAAKFSFFVFKEHLPDDRRLGFARDPKKTSNYFPTNRANCKATGNTRATTLRHFEVFFLFVKFRINSQLNTKEFS